MSVFSFQTSVHKFHVKIKVIKALQSIQPAVLLGEDLNATTNSQHGPMEVAQLLGDCECSLSTDTFLGPTQNDIRQFRVVIPTKSTHSVFIGLPNLTFYDVIPRMCTENEGRLVQLFEKYDEFQPRSSNCFPEKVSGPRNSTVLNPRAPCSSGLETYIPVAISQFLNQTLAPIRWLFKHVVEKRNTNWPLEQLTNVFTNHQPAEECTRVHHWTTGHISQTDSASLTHIWQ